MKQIADAHKRYLQQSKWTQDLRRYILESIGLTDHVPILEIGSGTSAVLGQVDNSHSLFALDIEIESLEFSKNKHEEIHHLNGDAFRLPISSNSMDIAYAHYMLLWVKNPELVLSEMKRVTRPGGWIIAFAEPDYGGRINFPESLDELGILQAQVLEDQGADTHMGRKLAYHFSQTGLDQIQYGVMGFQKDFTDRNFEKAEHNMLAKDIEGPIPTDTLKSLLEKERLAIKSGTRINFVPTFYAFGQKG